MTRNKLLALAVAGLISAVAGYHVGKALHHAVRADAAQSAT
jgi:hypothetical protein